MNAKTSIPVFQQVFQDQWQILPAVIKKRYAIAPYSDQSITVEGLLDVSCKWFIWPVTKIMGVLPPYNQKKVPVTVIFRSQPDNAAFCFDRTFYFHHKPPFKFFSSLFQEKGTQVAEVTRIGLCSLFNMEFDGTAVKMVHAGYAWQVGGKRIKLPLTWLLGRVKGSEKAVDEHHFDMQVSVTHWLLGELYRYEGRFKLVEDE